MSKLILVSGSVRSGKSAFAEEMAVKMDKPLAYLATAQALDEEMAERIRRHRQNRGEATWFTFEEPYHLADVLVKHQHEYRTWLLDCITLYISNLLLNNVKHVKQAEEKIPIRNNMQIQELILAQVDAFLATLQKTEVTLIAVTNEVGWGLVPPDPLGRAYRDILGLVNQKLAQAADEVYLLTMGIPLRLKSNHNLFTTANKGT